MKTFIVPIIVIILLFASNVSAKIVINEIYPAPPTGEFEFVELFNDATQSANLEEYALTDLNNSKLKINSQIIEPFGFEIATSSSVLNNSGDTVILKNLQNEVIDIATYSGSFNFEKVFARCPDGTGDFIIANIITKKISNSTACPQPTENPISTITALPTASPSPTLPLTPYSPSYNNIYISEVMVNPQSGESEWIEIYNDNDFEVYLDNWYLDDLEGAGSAPKLLKINVSAKDYAVFNLQSSVFNNGGDAVRVLDSEKNEKDSFEYSDSEKGKTLGRVSIENDIFCVQEPSKGKSNNPCVIIEETPIPTPTPYKIISKITISPHNPLPLTHYTPPNNFKTVVRPPSTILGSSTTRKVDKIPKALSFISISNSILTIVSVLLKMKTV